MAALRPIALQPKGYVLTFVDLGPRLITVTHHDAIAGPYHRNTRTSSTCMRAFRGTRRSARRRRAARIDYVLICPNLSESTIYASRRRRTASTCSWPRPGARLAGAGAAARQLALPDVAGQTLKLTLIPSITN
jgi:hypothetical protein